jgi:hypothetical protein
MTPSPATLDVEVGTAPSGVERRVAALGVLPIRQVRIASTKGT